MAISRIGGSFAPPLTDDMLVDYAAKINVLGPSPLKDVLLTLLNCCKVWWELPEPDSKNAKGAHMTGAPLVNLSPDHMAALDTHIPWSHELESFEPVLEAVTDKVIRDMAFHLFWHVKELNLDREPITKDKL